LHKKILITGGAGFIGAHLANELLAKGYHVRVLDELLEQVHGATTSPSSSAKYHPSYLNPAVELIKGSVCNPSAVRYACADIDVVYHLAARVGVGQSMYDVVNYTETNNRGTAVLLEALIARPVERLVVASSMSVYGEGLYQRRDGAVVSGHERPLEQLRAGRWQLYDDDGDLLLPLPTPETKAPTLASVYALSKYDQERMCLIIGRAYNIPTVALRFFNVYGPHQALSNPYTGVLAIFASRLLNHKAPLIYEDGYQQRDFVHVRDVAQACRLAMETPGIDGEVFNVGSGQAYTVLELAERLAAVMGKAIAPEVTGKYRQGDIRHCFADITKACEQLHYRPRISLDEGMAELANWLEGQIAIDQITQANRELERRGLTV
jgi:dTDP-L-rhamnose 4-epimerase